MFSSGQYIDLPKDLPPQLIVVVDTEEEFDWEKPFDKNNMETNAISSIGESQKICDEFGLKPCYVIDYPIATTPLAISTLKPILDNNRCEIGAHLHPWVNPPYEETVNVLNSYPGNLPRTLELEKLTILTQAIEKNFNKKPITYKAGRYGFGSNTQACLQKLGYKIDLSFCPPMDFRNSLGPNYSDFKGRPSWLDLNKNILEIPVSGAIVSPFNDNAAHHIYHASQRLKYLKSPGLLAKLGIVDRLLLSPEGFSLTEHIKLTKYLYRCGVRTFTWSFHSPSLYPGNTPYVKNKQQLAEFLDAFRSYFDFFLGPFNGAASTPTQIKSLIETRQ